MRVAICLSGFPRTMEYSYPYFKKYILDEFNPDIFFYGYTDIDNGLTTEKILDYYKPQAYVLREYNQEVQEEIWDIYGTKNVIKISLAKGSPTQILSQYYNMYGSNQLKIYHEINHEFQYDLVIRARTDYYFYRPFNSAELVIQNKTVYIPDIWDFGGVSSGFAYGNSTSMDIYSNLFNKIREYNLKHKVIFHPETLKGYHIKQSGLKRAVVQNHYWWDLEDFKTNGYSDRYIPNLTQNPKRSKFQ